MKKAPIIPFHVAILAGIWLFMQIFCYRHFGIVTNFEATKYMEQAQQFLQTGTYNSTNFLFYSTQIQLIALCLKFNLHFGTIVVLQLLLNGCSAVCFYHLCKRFSGNAAIAFFSTAYFLIFLYYHLYNVYLFTESLFFSLSILYTYFLFTRTALHFKTILLILPFLALLYFTRPTGVFFVPATVLFAVLKFYPKKAALLLTIFGVTGLALFYLLLNFSLGSGGEFDFVLPYLGEQIICGVPTLKELHVISVPGEKNSIQGLLYIITHHFQLFFHLSIKRLIAFFGIYRPYYSAAHNLFAQTYFYLIYILIIIGVRHLLKQYKPEVWFMIALIALAAVTVALSCDEWHNRFILAVLPFFLLLGVISFSNLRKRWMIKH